jgi:hypothetical protein
MVAGRRGFSNLPTNEIAFAQTVRNKEV